MTQSSLISSLHNSSIESPPPALSKNSASSLSPLPLLHELGRLYIALHNIIRDFEKLERYTLGVTIEKTVLDCITACHAATTLREPKEKYEKINAASSLFDTVKLLVRIGIEIHQIEERQFVNLIPRFGKIGRMLGGWMRVTAKPTQNQNQS